MALIPNSACFSSVLTTKALGDSRHIGRRIRWAPAPTFFYFENYADAMLNFFRNCLPSPFFRFKTARLSGSLSLPGLLVVSLEA